MGLMAWSKILTEAVKKKLARCLTAVLGSTQLQETGITTKLSETKNLKRKCLMIQWFGHNEKSAR
jgi:hypothetical protein